ncbi:MAG: ABC transporter ATP-binding protein [Rhizobacter sp.]|nr:ABC transporter ATP-binding protein [Chlorobiales bacterium]
MILSASGLFKSYLPKGGERIEILRGVSLDIAENELVTIVGASGSGKTTLLNILGTLDTPDRGEVQFQNTPVFRDQKFQLSGTDLARFRNTKIGFIFQFHHLLEDFTAIENAAMPNFILTNDMAAAKRAAETLLVSVGLGDRLTHLPSELSGGEQQRVAVARALVNRPLLVLADEPSGNLDTQNSEHLYELMASLAREQQTSFVIVTHNERYAALSGRSLRMTDGLLSASQPD